MSDFTDPRDLGGEITGPGGPLDHGGVIVDSRHAILVDGLEVCLVDAKTTNGQTVFALLVEGRINQSTDRAKVMLFEPLDGLASIVTEIHGVVERAGLTKEFHALCDERWVDMPFQVTKPEEK